MTARRAIVTGASSGIGAATALQLASEGYGLWLTYTSQERAVLDVVEACKKAGSLDVHYSQLNLRDSESVAALIASIEKTWDYCHVLVNNGGICPYQHYEDITDEDWDGVLETNARGTFLLTRASLPLLRASTGDKSIVNISSLAAQMGGITAPIHYAASKAAVLAISRSFARQLAPENIRVNSVTPGSITTPITDHLDAEKRETMANLIPLGQFGTPEDVAWTVAGLASPRSGFVTGATYDINGGVRID
jgi:3-oxoacyl-[acyl-carrier protein] reductase